MEKLYLLIDLDRCYGCKVCQTACKMEHGYPVGVQSAIEAVRLERTDNNGKLQCDFVPAVCLHCDDPECMNNCPAGAIGRDENGFIQIDKDSCIGCGVCEASCPYGAVTVGTVGDDSYAIKCDLCKERRARGMEPACVQHCLGQAITVETEKELARKTSGRNRWAVGQTVYVSSKMTNLFGD